ncbi:MAG: hypothetical protein IT361_01465 [Gemmatimonadaceae bacterium]|nr:hypothetical protein [Gemmatimonadaceae bacterium]
MTSSVRATQLIRVAMLSGVVMFGAVIYFMRRSPDAIPGTSPEQARSLLWIGRAIWGTAILGSMILWYVIGRTRDAARRLTYCVSAWALAEMVGLYGGVIAFLTGSWSWYAPGLVFLALSLLAFPLQRE